MDEILKYSKPTRYTLAAYGQIYRAVIEDVDNISILWIQTSKDTEKPNWERLGCVLEKALARFMTEDKFRLEILNLFEDEMANESKHIFKIITQE